MAVKFPQADLTPQLRGGADAWDVDPAGVILRDDYFEAAAGGSSYDRTADITSASTVAAVAGVARPRVADIASASDLAAAAAVGKARVADIASTTTVAAVATASRARVADIASASTLATLAGVARPRVAGVDSASSLDAVWTLARARTADISSDSTLAAVATVERGRVAGVVSASALDAVRDVIRSRVAGIDSASTVAATFTIAKDRAADILSTSALDATGTVNTTLQRSVDIAADVTVTAVAGLTRLYVADVSTSSEMDADPDILKRRIFDPVSTSDMTVARTIDRGRSAAVVSVSLMGAEGFIEGLTMATVDFNAFASMSAANTATRRGSVIFGAVCLLDAGQTILGAYDDLDEEGTLHDMAHQFSMLSIMNTALISQGFEEILSENDGTAEWRLLSRNWPGIVESELEDGLYSFTREEATLLSRQPGKFGYTDSYLVPDGSLHVRRLWITEVDEDVDWMQDQRAIHVNAADGVTIEYVASSDASLWGANFTVGVQRRLEAVLLRFKEEFSEADAMERSAELAFSRARTKSSKSRSATEPYRRSRYSAARSGRGSY